MITLNDKTTIPQLGFGTYLVQPEETAAAVSSALEVGYRHIDTAQMYENEAGVGAAVAASGLPRDELYLTSKLSNAAHRPDDVRRTFGETLDRLRVDYLDLFLIHWPLPSRYDGDFVSTWKAMTELVADGRLRSAGVSNFEPGHLERIIGETGVAPAVNQIEAHPYFPNTAAREASLAHGIKVEAWGPLAQGAVLHDETIAKIAAAHGRAASQVVLRWHIQRGDIIFPKSMRPERMRENFALFDFVLTDREMATIDALDKGAIGRVGPNPGTFDWIPS
ncbi:aldo/keto reductase [Dactylosporangium salmoneum]|uniref:Aldo/keto reductase n=1 Tax=Dactylosporangium salmoneum TaxID=53361 RepID=A0ABP5SJD3_9ACTN